MICKLLALALLLSGPAWAQDWRSYHNDRFGPTADYPAGWTMAPAPENNDGRRFTAPDGDAFVIVSGHFALDSRTEEMARAAEAGDGETVTYSAKGGNWVVVSGFRGDRIFYRKSLLSCGDQVWNNLYVEYPARDKARFDRLVSHMAASLRPGEGYNISCN